MNKHDRDNLKFLLSADEETFQEFLETVSLDDINYAIELIQSHRAELMVHEMALEESVDEEFGLDLSEAQAVLAKFRL